MPKVPKKATFGTTIGTFQVFSIVFPDGNQDASEITSRRILYYVATYLLLRRDVANTASGRIFHCIRMYLLQRQDVSFTASGCIFCCVGTYFSSFIASKNAKNDRKRLVFNRKNNVFAQCAHSFCPKKTLKRLFFTDFLQNVATRGNKVATKTPLIATRYQLIIKELSTSVANVALI